MPNLFEEFRVVVAALGGARVPYAICGGVAMSIHAHPRATIDIDLLAPAESVVKIVEVLLPHGFLRRERAPTRLAEGEIVMHPLTKIVPEDPEVLALDVIEVHPLVGIPRRHAMKTDRSGACTYAPGRSARI